MWERFLNIWAFRCRANVTSWLSLLSKLSNEFTQLCEKSNRLWEQDNHSCLIFHCESFDGILKSEAIQLNVNNIKTNSITILHLFVLSSIIRPHILRCGQVCFGRWSAGFGSCAINIKSQKRIIVHLFTIHSEWSIVWGNGKKKHEVTGTIFFKYEEMVCCGWSDVKKWESNIFLHRYFLNIGLLLIVTALTDVSKMSSFPTFIYFKISVQISFSQWHWALQDRG